MYDPKEALKTLNFIWSHSRGDYVHLPFRTVHGAWTENPIGAEGVTATDLDMPGCDTYFSPLRFDTVGRKLSDVGSPGVLFADLDTAEPYGLDFVKPNLVWETSPGSMQAVWLLEKPTDDIMLWRETNQRLTYALGADKGGWMENKVLRVPGSPNWKRAKDGVPAEGTPASGYGYYLDLQEVHDNLPPVSSGSAAPEVPSVQSREYRDKLLAESPLPLSMHYWLRMTPEEYQRRRKPDRSFLIMKTAYALSKIGYPIEDALALIYYTPWNKWPHSPVTLWRQIWKAYN